MTKILGVDHICTSCKNVDIASKSFKSLKYDIMFMEHGLQSPKEKKSYLKNFTVNHDAAFLKSKKGLAIEVIDHNSNPIEIFGPYKVLLNQGHKSLSDKENITKEPINKIIENALGFSVTFEKIPNYEISYYNNDKNSDGGLSAVIIECQNLLNSIKFWKKGIGFQIIKKPRGKFTWCLMEFPGLTSSMKIKLLLIETKKTKKKSYLDYSGWTCLSFIVRRIDSALKQVKRYGAIDIGQPYKMEIGGNTLLLSFFRGPEGELIEFLEVIN